MARPDHHIKAIAVVLAVVFVAPPLPKEKGGEYAE
jgi:hypothetical protein